jgi:hypothetical protein
MGSNIFGGKSPRYMKKAAEVISGFLIDSDAVNQSALPVL